MRTRLCGPFQPDRAIHLFIVSRDSYLVSRGLLHESRDTRERLVCLISLRRFVA